MRFNSVSEMLKLVVILQLFAFIACDLNCQQCMSNERNSDCKNGNSTNIVNCPDDEEYCFAEEFIGENGNHVYRRGCSDNNKCNREARNLGASLKYCRVCNACDNCNNKLIKPVQNLSCQRCASEDPNSDCRNGTIQAKFQCPSDEPACYTEDIINEGRPPYYRRGCAPVDWCETQKNSHKAALKFCSVCNDRSMCNDKRIGSPDPSKLQCYKCSTEDLDNPCRTGSIDNNAVTCAISNQICLQYYVTTSRRDIWARECAKPDECKDLGKQYGHSLEECTECEDDYCNNVKLRVAIS